MKGIDAHYYSHFDKNSLHNSLKFEHDKQYFHYLHHKNTDYLYRDNIIQKKHILRRYSLTKTEVKMVFCNKK